MKFYNMFVKRGYEEDVNGKVFPTANFLNVLLAEYFKEKIRNRNYLDHTPLFDYFELISISHDDPYDWILNDAVNFAGFRYPVVRGFLASDYLQSILENFIIAEPYRFYASKLMYQGKKYDYAVFQIAYNHWEHLNYKESEFMWYGGELYCDDKDRIYRTDLPKISPDDFSDYEEYKKFNLLVSRQFKSEKKLSVKVNVKTAFLDKYYDVILDFNSANGILVSEEVKKAIEAACVTGLAFELYELTDFYFKDRI